MEVAGGYYLARDFRVTCYDAEWTAYSGVAAAGVALYIICIPLLFWATVMLVRNNHIAEYMSFMRPFFVALDVLAAKAAAEAAEAKLSRHADLLTGRGGAGIGGFGAGGGGGGPGAASAAAATAAASTERAATAATAAGAPTGQASHWWERVLPLLTHWQAADIASAIETVNTRLRVPGAWLEERRAARAPPGGAAYALEDANDAGAVRFGARDLLFEARRMLDAAAADAQKRRQAGEAVLTVLCACGVRGCRPARHCGVAALYSLARARRACKTSVPTSTFTDKWRLVTEYLQVRRTCVRSSNRSQRPPPQCA